MGTPHGIGTAIWLHTATSAVNMAHSTMRRTLLEVFVMIKYPSYIYNRRTLTSPLFRAVGRLSPVKRTISFHSSLMPSAAA